jgi:hypothetical protein
MDKMWVLQIPLIAKDAMQVKCKANLGNPIACRVNLGNRNHPPINVNALHAKPTHSMINPEKNNVRSVPLDDLLKLVVSVAVFVVQVRNRMVLVFIRLLVKYVLLAKKLN